MGPSLDILLAAPAYWPAHGFGGPVVAFRELVRRTVERGHRVTIEPRFRFMFGEARTRCGEGCRGLVLSRTPADRRPVGAAAGVFVLESAVRDPGPR